MKPTGTAADFIPPRATLPKLRAAAAGCRGCHLYKDATQSVFGAGPARARLMIVGEQPGDAEDLAGKPFVGPSGKLLDRALDAAGIDRREVYVTNAVKHFKFTREGKGEKRLHKSPNIGEVRACRPWLEHEIALIKPDVILCLGATAAKALLGATFSVMKSRGAPVESDWAAAVFATVHPSAVLRSPHADREAAERAFTADIKKVASWLTKNRPKEKRTPPRADTFSPWPTIARRSRTSKKSIRSSPK